MMNLTDIVVNPGDYIYFGIQRHDDEIIYDKDFNMQKVKYTDRSFCCPCKVIEIEMPLIKVKRPWSKKEHCLNLNDFPNWQKVSPKMVPEV